jgi:NADPH-dependent glutamate synthase beta subunit-like oxidoreductase
MAEPEEYAIAIIGGATAGAEAASIFSDHDILTVVFEQNARPYGKIEDGLPRWHVDLRRKEYATIDEKLGKPHVHFVPRTKIGKDVDLRELVDEWGFHAVVLANGAWRDRPLPVEGADAYVGRGLVYQNPFIYWFNHYVESSYDGPHYEIPDGTIVVGGGLASIDVVKVIQLELTLRALRERGIEEDLIELEVKGIPATLAKHGLRWEDLGCEGCTLYYRRRPEDMPLVDMPEGANDKVQERVRKSRARVLEKAMSKYLFEFQPLCAPVDLVVEGDRLVGLGFARTRVEEGRVSMTDERIEVRAPQVISSIGSIPEPTAGIESKGELYAFEDWELGRLPGLSTLFSVGNVVTGKGNIVASRKHARRVGAYVVSDYLGLVESVKKLAPLAPAARKRILERVRELQAHADYDGDYRAWIDAVTPPDMV